MKAYSEETGEHYDSWDELVQAEANGFVVCAVISDGKTSWPWVEGPFATKREATNAQQSLRTRMKREQENYPKQSFKIFIRPLWKDGR